MRAVKLAKTVEIVVFGCSGIVGHIYIPPGAVIIDTVPRVVGQ